MNGSLNECFDALLLSSCVYKKLICSAQAGATENIYLILPYASLGGALDLTEVVLK